MTWRKRQGQNHTEIWWIDVLEEHLWHGRLWRSSCCEHMYIYNLYIGVSKNRGTPKSSILIDFSTRNHPFWGAPTLETPIYTFENKYWLSSSWQELNLGHFGRSRHSSSAKYANCSSSSQITRSPNETPILLGNVAETTIRIYVWNSQIDQKN